MDDQGWSNTNTNEPLRVRLVHVLEGWWPTIYRYINAFFYGVIDFIKMIINGFFPGR